MLAGLDFQITTKKTGSQQTFKLKQTICFRLKTLEIRRVARKAEHTRNRLG